MLRITFEDFGSDDDDDDEGDDDEEEEDDDHDEDDSDGDNSDDGESDDDADDEKEGMMMMTTFVWEFGCVREMRAQTISFSLKLRPMPACSPLLFIRNFIINIHCIQL